MYHLSTNKCHMQVQFEHSCPGFTKHEFRFCFFAKIQCFLPCWWRDPGNYIGPFSQSTLVQTEISQQLACWMNNAMTFFTDVHSVLGTKPADCWPPDFSSCTTIRLTCCVSGDETMFSHIAGKGVKRFLSVNSHR